jgi:flavin reductase (DIM6/NTAB) family NADH-FMN oxidoreductase RutF
MPAGFDDRAYRNALGCYATGVAVLTALASTGEHLGLTLNSLTSVSLQPPLVSFCLGQHLARFEILTALEVFNLNVLRADQAALSAQFARAGADKWRGVKFKLGSNGIRVLEPHLALLECQRFQGYQAGDHQILIAEVKRFRHDHSGAPLLFYRGRYHRLADPPSAD